MSLTFDPQYACLQGDKSDKRRGLLPPKPAAKTDRVLLFRWDWTAVKLAHGEVDAANEKEARQILVLIGIPCRFIQLWNRRSINKNGARGKAPNAEAFIREECPARQ